MPAPYLLSAENFDFPDPNLTLADPNGLLAIGGDLSCARLINAYEHGIFPWYSNDQPILWWSPDPRAVLFLDQLKISRSLKKTLRHHSFNVSYDRDFAAVIAACAAPRGQGGSQENGTWISKAMQQAYLALHRQGHAHSVEVWQADKLVGGLYGVIVKRIFCGESMFSREIDASKIALVYLVNRLAQENFKLIDCQIMNPHLHSLGASEIPRQEFLAYLA